MMIRNLFVSTMLFCVGAALAMGSDGSSGKPSGVYGMTISGDAVGEPVTLYVDSEYGGPLGAPESHSDDPEMSSFTASLPTMRIDGVKDEELESYTAIMPDESVLKCSQKPVTMLETHCTRSMPGEEGNIISARYFYLLQEEFERRHQIAGDESSAAAHPQ